IVEKLPSAIESEVVARGDLEKRLNTSHDYSAANFLQAAMKAERGDHGAQKGALVCQYVLRFEFAHLYRLSDEESKRVDNIVNNKIRENVKVDIVEMSKDDALGQGATALFGEKYGNKVRVVTMDPSFSVELCGGTHIPQTGMIGVFATVSESAVASGVRRIEALTGGAALNYFADKINQSRQITESLKASNPLKALEEIISENQKLKKELEKATAEKVKNMKQQLIAQVENINGINFIGRKVDLPHADAVKSLAYALRDSIDNLFLVLGADFNGKPNLTVMISDNLIKEKNLNAGTIIRELAKEIQGGGGGQPFYATAGGKRSEGLDNAIAGGKAFI